MRIAFVHARTSFLPEIAAYHRFFNRQQIETVSIDFRDAKKVQADVMWWIMGFSSTKIPGAVTIHEYLSASAPPFAQIKNLMKTRFNTRPDYRLFLNDYVKQAFYFNDHVPFGYRDMGVDLATYYPEPSLMKTYDFIYVGNVHYTRELDALFNCFAKGAMKDRTLLVLSRAYENLAMRYAAYSNISFNGPVRDTEVRSYINRARFAINYIPDKTPYNGQTSTKLLEYAACQVPIISTSYAWIRNFQLDYGGQYFFLDKDLLNFEWEAVNRFQYAFPDLSSWQWEKQIEKSGVLAFLKQKFPLR